MCTTRQESAEATAGHFGIRLAFSDPDQLARHPDIDLVTVTVKVPDHYRPVMAAIEAGKHVYCEWPLGRNTGEARKMLDAAERKGVRHAGIGNSASLAPLHWAPCNDSSWRCIEPPVVEATIRSRQRPPDIALEDQVLDVADGRRPLAPGARRAVFKRCANCRAD